MPNRSQYICSPGASTRATGRLVLLALWTSLQAERQSTWSMLHRTMSSIFNVDTPLVVPLGIRNIFTALSTHCNIVQKTICCDVKVMSYEFERMNVSKFVWIPGNHNFVNTGTKSDSHLLYASGLTVESGGLRFYFPTTALCFPDRSLCCDSGCH